MKRKIFTCGTSYTFSGPIQPPLLGAIIESAKIHLSDEINTLQQKLKDKIEYTRKVGQELQLPEVSSSLSPIFYYALGHPRVGYSMIKKLMQEGYYTNIGIFPTVPVNCTGLRIPVSLNLADEDIKGVLEAFAYHFPKTLEEENVSLNQLSRSFKMPFEETKKRFFEVIEQSDNNAGLMHQHENSIEKVDKRIWNNCLGDNGSFDWEGCAFIEKTFTGNPEEENNWEFNYLIIKDSHDKVVLATFFTVAMCKDDMVASDAMSREIEEKRQNDKYFLTSKVVTLGSLITEGEHLYINREHKDWKKAVLELIKTMSNVKQQAGASAIQLRDFDTEDSELKEIFINEGFIRFDLPDSHVVLNKGWKDPEEFIESLSKKSRYHVRKNMSKNEDVFEVKVDKLSDIKELDKVYELYLNVKRQSFKLNTFDLPLKMFQNAFIDKNWELIRIKIKEKSDDCCFVLCYKSALNNYSPIVIGIDYSVNQQYGCYRQALYQIVKQGIENKCKNIYFGMDASIEKKKIGAIVLKKSLYLQADDNFSLDTSSVFSQKN